MAADKYIELGNDGSLSEKIPGTSGGVGDANKIPALSATGQLAEAMMPDGVIPIFTDATASEAIASGDFVNLWNDGGTLKARKADATSASKYADGYVKIGKDVDEVVRVYHEDFNDQKSGMTIGAKQFLSASTPGKTQETPPTTANYIVQILGKAVSATKMTVEIQDPVKKA